MGFHKAVIADMDTDSQSKSKLFGYQLILDDKLSLALQPSEFRNMAKKYSRDIYGELPTAKNDGYMPAVIGVDWFMQGSMLLLSHKDKINFKHQVLNEFAKKIKEGEENPQALKNRFILKMNQFNYNYQTKLSFISGYIEYTNQADPLPSVHWRTVTLKFAKNSSKEPYESGLPPFPKAIYMRYVDKDNAKGILVDLNNLLEVVTVG
jgi:hypothetical protein